MKCNTFLWILFGFLIRSASSTASTSSTASISSTASTASTSSTSSTASYPELNTNFKSYELTDVTVAGPVGGNMEVTFSAFGEKFAMKLRRAYNKRVNVTLSSRYGRRTLDLEPSYFTGRLTDKLASFAHGVQEGAAFSGSVYPNGRGTDDIIYVEPLCRFVKTVDCGNVNSVVYKRSEVRLDDKGKHMLYKQAPSTGARFKGSNNHHKKARRQKRGVIDGTICQVFFTIDHTFYQQYAQSNPRVALAETCYFLMEASKAFEDTDFDGDGAGDKVGFDMRGLHIFETADAPDYKMSGNLDSDPYLEAYSEYNWEDYCLSVAFAHRDFSGGVLGLAFIATTAGSNKAGGICQPRLVFINPPMSYNTLIVTNLNYGQTQPKGGTSLTLTHEFGHSFGSNHDDDGNALCSPSNADGGKYVMHPFSSATTRPNNWRFSPCSRNEINPVLSDKSGCFVAKKEPFCGDALIDPGEQCDCGPDETCDVVDPCCVAHQCVFKAGKTCTPLDVTKTCCTQDCLAASSALMCQLGGQCKEDTYCDGSNAACPTPVAKLDGTFCYGNTAVCKGGSCSASVCTIIGLEECQCAGEAELCFVCCKTAGGDCLPVEKADPNQNKINDSIPSVPGQSCNDFKGFCDDGGQCRKTGRKGARDRLNKFLRDGMLKRWFANYGLYIGLSVAALIVLTIVLKKIYKKKTASKSPAYNMAKVALLWQEANKHYDQLSRKLERMRSEFKDFVKEGFVFDYNHMSEGEVDVSIAKLILLFPSVPQNVIQRKVKMFNSEEKVVEKFINEGHEMKKILPRKR